MSIRLTHDTYEGIPYVRYEKDTDGPKPLLFFFHGFTSDKDKGIMGRGETLANLGYTVIAIDALAHGERYDETLIGGSASQKYRHLVDIILRTAEDALTLYNGRLVQDTTLKAEPYGAYGVSMGAAIAFALAHRHAPCEHVVSIVGSPSLYALYAYKQRLFEWAKDDAYLKRMEYYRTIDPLLHAERFTQKSIFMGCGVNDEVVPLRYARALYDACASDLHVLKTYDTAHESTPQMLEDANRFLLETLKP